MDRTNLQKFNASLSGKEPPAAWSAELRALWWDARGDWDRAHDISQELKSKTGMRIHAYLHRKEGDDWNAGYWYKKASQPFPQESVDREADAILRDLLNSR